MNQNDARSDARPFELVNFGYEWLVLSGPRIVAELDVNEGRVRVRGGFSDEILYIAQDLLKGIRLGLA